MVIKKGKHDIRCGGQIKSVSRFRAARYMKTTGTATFTTTFPMESNETFNRRIEYSLNKRKRWQLPAMLSEKLSSTVFDEDTQSKKAFAIVEYPGSSASWFGRTRSSAASRLVYFDKKYGKPLEVTKGTGKFIDSYNVITQLQRGKYSRPKKAQKTLSMSSLSTCGSEKADNSISVWHDPSQNDDVERMDVYTCRPLFLKKKMATYRMSEKTYKLGYKWGKAMPAPRSHMFTEETRDIDKIHTEDVRVEEEDHDENNMPSPVPELPSVTLGDLMTNRVARQKKKTEKKWSPRIQKAVPNATSEEPDVPSPLSPLVSVTKEGVRFGPVSIVLPVEAVKACAKLSKLNFGSQNSFAFNVPTEPWWLYLNYSNDCVCDAVVLVASSLQTKSLSLHEAYSTVEELLSDVKSGLLIEDGSAFEKQLLKYRREHELPIFSLDKPFPFNTEGFSVLLKPQVGVFPKPIGLDTGLDSWDLGEEVAERPCCTHSSEIDECPINLNKLKPCSHPLCCACLKDKVMAAIEGGCTTFLCPELNCTTKLDDALLVLLIGVDGFEKVRKNREKLVARCSCGGLFRVAELNYSDYGIPVSCPTCLKDMCFHCGSEPHWPSSCDEAKLVASDKIRNKHANFFQGYVSDNKNCLLCCEGHLKESHVVCVCNPEAVKRSEVAGSAANSFCYKCNKRGMSKTHESKWQSATPCWHCGYVDCSDVPAAHEPKQTPKSPSSVRANWVQQMGTKLSSRFESADIAAFGDLKLHILDNLDEGRIVKKFELAFLAAKAFSEYHKISTFTRLIDDIYWGDPTVAEEARSIGKELYRSVSDFCQMVLLGRSTGQKLLGELAQLDKVCFRLASSLAKLQTQR